MLKRLKLAGCAIKQEAHTSEYVSTSEHSQVCKQNLRSSMKLFLDVGNMLLLECSALLPNNPNDLT